MSAADHTPPPSPRDQWLAAGRLSGRGLAAVVDIAGDTQQAVNRRVRRFLPPVARPVHDGQAAMAAGVYRAVAGAHRTAPELAARLAPADVAPSASALGRVGLPIVNGTHGDLLAAEHDALAIRMGVVVDGDPLHNLGADDLAGAFPAASGTVVVFVHGWVDSFRCWDYGRPGSAYPDRLERDLGVTSVLIGYNSGLHISENGRQLSDLLERMVAGWPVPVERVILVGHSMGGLVCRSACHQGSQQQARWVDRVGAVVTLGTPHRGAPLEKTVNAVDWVLRRIPETEPLGRLVARRSAGVKDLRFGSLLEEDWAGHDPDEFLRNRCQEVPFLPHARYYWVAATLTEDKDHPWGRLIGDGLVRLPSAAGPGHGRSMTMPLGEGRHVGRLGHLALVNNDAVYLHLREWVAADAAE